MMCDRALICGLTLLDGKSVDDEERIQEAYVSVLIWTWCVLIGCPQGVMNLGADVSTCRIRRSVFIQTQIFSFTVAPQHLRFVNWGVVALF
ncbi:hypothetical protein C8Q76DRAFT_243210 [Earliella scabrosa]|nr:hypothetical protein C8Q76DRAFT_243210 [Earliella scabrosa]